MTYPEIVHAQLQKIINLWLEYEQHYSKEKRLERMRISVDCSRLAHPDVE